MKSESKPKESSDLRKARDETVAHWLDLFVKDSLSYVQFLSHWAFWVPKAFIPVREVNAYEPILNEDIFQTLLISTIEGFIFDGREDLHKSFNDLCKLMSVCGKIFKGGDPFYSCRDCGTDSTCVLCASCFMVSAHKNHNYKIGTSAGGGCCDCGDVLSWKSDPHCTVHFRGMQNASSISFTQDLISRTELVTSAILQYCFEISMLKPSSSLPKIFKSMDNEDILGAGVEDYHCLVLFNDESHSFDQVASCLSSVIKCSSIGAYGIATYVDKEGRAILAHATYSKCNELKSNLERFTSLHNIQPLKMEILDWQILTHQMYSFKLLFWLENFMKQTKQFRDIVTSISLNMCRKDISLILGSQNSLVEEILLHNSVLWKSARVRWYHLFLSVILVDQNNKIAFANIFTTNYGTIVKNFIQDDHEHVFSVASLSVQIFTVPSIAHYLIASKDAMSIMLYTFFLECINVCNKAGKLEFPHRYHNASQIHFFRSFCVLHDLRYILNSPPVEWTSDLRSNFMRGISILLDIFLLMEDMCANKREMGQHMEFESEWRQEFKLQIKLTPVISHVLNWCSTDQIITIKSYRLTLKKIFHYYNTKLNDEPWSVVSLTGHSLKSYNYIAASQPISIHLPLLRFLAGLYLHLLKFGFDFNFPEFNAFTKPSPLQIIEPVLRIQVMIAQVHAGMWRRNGLSLPNQILCYQSSKCRGEMLDQDIILLQIGASLIESNRFLLNILHKFNLLHWARPEFESLEIYDESIKEVIILSEEFLTLLITIIGERYNPGVGKVTTEECLQNEIVHRLFIKPSLHSELYSFLPDSDCFKPEMENVIDKVATFQKLDNFQKGVYTVKRELSNKYNCFFYHYTKEERSISEEEQRKTWQDIGFPIPPPLPKLSVPFQNIACLLHSDVLLCIIRTVLIRSLSDSAKCFSENQFHRVLFLIGLALQEEECFCNAKFSVEAEKWDLKPLLEKLLDSQHLQAYRNLIHWLLRKFKSFTNSSNDEESKDSEEKSSCNISDKELERSKLVAERQAVIMAQMSALQQNFINHNSNVFQTLKNNSIPQDNNARSTVHKEMVTCILCQETQTINQKSSSIVCAAFIQKSALSKGNMANTFSFFPVNSGRQPVHVNTCGHFMHAACWKEYLETTYFEETRRPFRLRQLLAYDITKNEYLCPLCKCLSNTILPMLPHVVSNESKIPFDVWIQPFLTSSIDNCRTKEQPFEEYWNNCTMLTSTKPDNDAVQAGVTFKRFCCPLLGKVLTNTSIDSPSGSETESSPDPGVRSETPERWNFSKETITTVELFTTSLDAVSGISSPIKINIFLVWHSCAYTIRSLEKYFYFIEKPLLDGFTYRQETCLRNLVNLSTNLSMIDKEKLIKSKFLNRVFFNLLGKQDSDCTNILQWDCFDLVILLMLASSNASNSKTKNGIHINNNVYRFCLLLQFAQNILLKDISNVLFLQSDDITSNDTECLSRIVRSFINCRGVDTVQLWNLLKAYSLPFLRCCAIWHYFLTGIEPSQGLKETGGDTFENIMDFLGMCSSCEELFDCPFLELIFKKWAENQEIEDFKNRSLYGSNGARDELIRLPYDYCELINTASSFSCPNSHREDTRIPTICLVCGTLLCGDMYCCQNELEKVLVGSCTYHSHHCGAGNGIFLQISNCQILLLSSSPSRGCFMPAPYFDEYGESDQGLFRGNPLYLSEEQYNRLQKLWLSHGIQEEISRAIESSRGFSPTQWSLL